MTSLWLDDHQPVPADPFVPDSHYDAVVVGAGLTGLTTALMLAKEGLSVGVVEARFMGAVTTGNTTAKLSLLQGTVLSGIRSHNSDEVLRAYVDGNRAAQEWLLTFLAENNVQVQRRDAYTYAGTPESTEAINREYAACQKAGLNVSRVQETELPYPSYGAIRLDNQAQFNPMDVLNALALELRSLGGVLVEGARVHGVDVGNPVTVSTQLGKVFATRVIVATGAPILDRGLYFAKLKPTRSYAQAFRVPGAPESIPQGMYLSADSPSRSLRTASFGGEVLLVVGGNGHGVGRNSSTLNNVNDLETWTKNHFPGAERTHSWSAQDYESANMVPFVGWLPRGNGKIFLATGYNKWGMSNAVAAALSLTAGILDRQLPWAQKLQHRITGPKDVASGIALNAEVGGLLAAGWASAELHRLPQEPPAEGSGIVGNHHLKPTAVSTVDGEVCRLSAVCPHLGGILSWNDAERSWDCPLHGSRFTATGALLEGPATEDLEVLR